METVLVDWGLPALFCVSFLAATVLPIASEWLLAAIVIQPVDMTAAVAVATVGNTLGAVTTWAVGCWGGLWVMQRWLRISAADRLRAENGYTRWGSWSLLFAWAPVVGDPLCLVAGLFNVPLMRFIPLVAIGKAGRYLIVAWAARQLVI
jgi:membrane protein YqaA with SNARE-associated domain